MKKIIYTILLLAVVFLTWCFYSEQNFKKSPIVKTAVEGLEPQPASNPVDIGTNTAAIKPESQAKNSVELAAVIINALALTNLEQWKMAIKNLKPLAGFEFQQHWLVEQPGRTNGIPIVLSLDNKKVQYSAVLVSILAKNKTGDLMEVEMQTQNFDIGETRELGLQLCNMLNIDSKDFLTWTDKVGNHWLDAPFYGVGNKHYSFQIIRTYNDEKPWSINFMITPNS